MNPHSHGSKYSPRNALPMKEQYFGIICLMPALQCKTCTLRVCALGLFLTVITLQMFLLPQLLSASESFSNCCHFKLCDHKMKERHTTELQYYKIAETPKPSLLQHMVENQR